MNWLFKSLLIVILVIINGNYLPAQNDLNVVVLYKQRQEAIEKEDKYMLQDVNKQLIELGERPRLIFTKHTQNNIDLYEFVPAVDYSLSDINKINSRLKNAIPSLIEIAKLDNLGIKVSVFNDIKTEDLEHIFSVFRFTYLNN